MIFTDRVRAAGDRPAAARQRGLQHPADHVETAQLALAQLPKVLRRGRQTLIRIDSGGGTRAFLDPLSKRGRWLSCSVGMTITDAIHHGRCEDPEEVWTPAYDVGGTERPGAGVAEITHIPDLSTWPNGDAADRPQVTPTHRRPVALHRYRRRPAHLLRDQHQRRPARRP